MRELPKSVTKAKTILLFMFGTLLILDVGLVMVEPHIPGIVRLFLTMGLMWYVIQGYKWAKWLHIVLGLIGSMLLIGFGIYFATIFVAYGIMCVCFGILFSIVPLYIIFSKNLNIYFAAKRDIRFDMAETVYIERGPIGNGQE